MVRKNRLKKHEKTGISKSRLILYSLLIVGGIITLLCTGIFYNFLSTFWQNVLVNIGAGMIITTFFAFAIDKINTNISNNNRNRKRIDESYTLCLAIGHLIDRVICLSRIDGTDIDKVLDVSKQIDEHKDDDTYETSYMVDLAIESFSPLIIKKMDFVSNKVDFLIYAKVFSIEEIRFIMCSKYYYKKFERTSLKRSIILGNLVDFMTMFPSIFDLTKNTPYKKKH